MDPVEATEETRDMEEQQDLCDDHLAHRQEEEAIGELTTDIEKAPKQKKPRSKAQMEAFEKARKALALKRDKAKAEKETKKKPRGRPAKTKAPKAPKVVFEAPDTESSESSEEEVVYVQRKKPKKRKP